MDTVVAIGWEAFGVGAGLGMAATAGTAAVITCRLRVAGQAWRRLLAVVVRLVVLGLLSEMAPDSPRNPDYWRRQTFTAEITSMVANNGKSTGLGTKPSICPPIKLPAMEPAAVARTKRRLSRRTAKLLSRL
jgi:hypothetical protein